MYPSSMAPCQEDMASSESNLFHSLPPTVPLHDFCTWPVLSIDGQSASRRAAVPRVYQPHGEQQWWPRACLHHYLAATPSFSSPMEELTPSARLFDCLAGG